ncbi:PH domain-containing protein [Candidatus Saccharibacteria bacterium]|nr:PH domain-containing protein [Candidatus Saccharibacteria bacterium]
MSEMTFDGQREGEKVEFIFRRHIATARKGFWWCVLCIGLGIVPMVAWPGQTEMFWVFLGAVVVGVLGMLYAYILWYFSIYIVTNERLRQISQKGLFKKTVIDLGLDRVQSISYERAGIKSGLFNYGTILVQTAVGDLTISKVPHPEEIYNKLQNLVGKAGKNEED